jgi:hypothetical protein
VKRLLTLIVLAGMAIGCKSMTSLHPEERGYPLYYADVGPEEIDVSSYPPERREQYNLTKRVCSRCHNMARTWNSSTMSRDEWSYYILRMRLRGNITKGESYSRAEGLQIVDFLTYDAKMRKLSDLDAFEKQDRALRHKFRKIRSEHLKKNIRSLR